MRIHAILFLAAAACSSIALAEPSEKGRPADPNVAGGTVQIAPGGITLHAMPAAGSMRVMKQVTDAGMTTTVMQDDKEYVITEGDSGIRIVVNEPNVDPREFSAKDAESLKNESPEAFEIYDKYCGDGHKSIIVLADPNHGGAHFELPMHGGRIAALDRRCEFMPNPAMVAQLGGGVVVNAVNPDGRAAKLGLQQYDYIKTVNGAAVTTVKELEAAVEGADKLSMEIVRAGEEKSLTE